MSTLNIAWNNAGVVLGGTATVQSQDSGVHNFVAFGIDGELRGVFTGTDLAIAYWAGATFPLRVTVDGGTPFSPTLDGSFTWSTFNAFTGLTDTPHEVVLQAVNHDNIFFETDTHNKTFQLTGSSPSVAAPSGYTNTAANRLVLATDQASGTPKSVLEGMISPVNQGYACFGASFGGQAFGCGSIRFRAACSLIRVWIYLSSSCRYRLFVDGTPVAVATTSDGVLVFGWALLASGLDSTAQHEYEIFFDDYSGLQQVFEVMAVGGAGFDPTVRPAARPTQGDIGDSLSAAYPSPTSQSWPAIVARAQGMACANAGILGSTVSDGSAPMHSRTSSLTRLGSTMATCFVSGGRNDQAGSLSVPQFQTDYTTMLAALVAGSPACRFICLGIIPTKGNSSGGADVAYNGAAVVAVAAVKAATSSANITFLDSVPLAAILTNECYNSGDDVHPNALGDSRIASYVLSSMSSPAAASGTFAY